MLRYLKATAHHHLHFGSSDGIINDGIISGESDSESGISNGNDGSGNGNGSIGNGNGGSGDGCSGDGKLTDYTDSDWANDSHDRKSQGGHIFIVGGGAVSWQSRKQDLVATSTLEAEYIACSEASREARWLQQLQRDIGDQPDGHIDKPLPIYTDSQGASTHITTGITKARTKHIDVCYHNSRDLHARGIIKYDYVNTNDNPADILTKALPREKHEKFARAMGVRS